MSGFQPGGLHFGPPFNYGGGQYMPPFQTPIPYNNNMMPPQPGLQQPQFSQPRPPSYPQMPQGANQVHYANSASFHSNVQFHPSGYHQAQPPPPPQFYGYGQYNNNVSAHFTPNLQNQGFNAGPPPPQSLHTSVMTTPHIINSVPHTPASNTPVRSTFGAQRPPGFGIPFESREHEGTSVGVSDPIPQLRHDTASAAYGSSVSEVRPADPMPGIDFVGEKVVNAQEDLSLDDKPQPSANQYPLQVESIGLVENGVAEDQRDQEVDDSHNNSPLHNVVTQNAASTAISKENFYVEDLSDENISTGHPQVDSTEEPETHKKDSVLIVKRDQAKKAIRELNSHHIGFQELRAEQLNIDLLQQLYSELGLSIPSDRESGINSKAESALEEVSAATAKSPQTQKEQEGLAQELCPLVRPQPEKVLSNHKIELDVVDKDIPVPPASPQVLTGTSIKTSTPPLVKKPALAETADPSKGRKDYIARLLAAKAGIKQDPVAEQPKPNGIDARPQTPIQENPAKAIQPASNSQAASDFKKSEMKDPKQTELIRQRLEALKNSAKNQQSPSKQLSPATNPDQTEAAAPSTAKESNEVETGQETNEQPRIVEVPAVDGHRNAHGPYASFFVPSDRSSFSILPGLPGLSSFPPVVSPLAEAPSAIPAEESDENGETLWEDEKGSSEAIEAYSPKKESRAQAEILPDIPVEAPQVSEIAVRTSAPSTESRKRPTAADFIDSPPHKVARRTAPSEPIHLVIDVSDDEEEVLANKVDKDQLPQDEVNSSPAPQPLRDENINDRKGLRELPPLSNFPPRSVNAFNRTPQAQTPLLAQQEEHIRQMKMRIAEAEHRRKAKRFSETPAASEPAHSPVVMDAALAKTVDSKQQAIKELNEQLERREKALAVAKRGIQEKLEAERRDKARVAALAEKERQEAARATSIAERELRLARKSTLEAALPSLDAQIHTAKAKLEDMKRQQEDIQAEIQRGNEGRTALMTELSELLKALEADKDVEQSKEAKKEDEKSLREAESVPRTGDEPASGARAFEPSPLPSKITIPSDSNVESKAALPTPQTAKTDLSVDIMDIASSSEDEGQIIESSHSPSRVSRDLSPAHSQTDVDYEPRSVRSEESIDDYEPAAPDQDLAPETMHHSTSRTSPEDTDMKGNEDYEPSLEIEVISPASAPPPTSPSNTLPPMSANRVPSTIGLEPSDQGNVDDSTRSAADQTPLSHSSLQEEGEATEEEEDSNDYEPPEVSNPVMSTSFDASKDATQVTELSGLVQESNAMDLDAEPHRSTDAGANAVGDLIANASETEASEEHAPQHLATGLFNHFTPYQSPLHQFKSYRFHPKYVEDVPGGFHSLTFNHKINPNETLCRWELAGGICSDSSCEYQHFRDLPLTDNNLLLELGSVHEGATREEKEAYIAGLKQMIAGMRDKNLRDVTTIASEIVAYRSRFLKDPSRVLTNV